MEQKPFLSDQSFAIIEYEKLLNEKKELEAYQAKAKIYPPLVLFSSKERKIKSETRSISKYTNIIIINFGFKLFFIQLIIYYFEKLIRLYC